MDELFGGLMFFGGLMPPFGRIGGKSRLKKRIVDVFPENYTDLIYVEPFFGAGSVFFYKEPSEHEVINDLDKDIYTLLTGFKKYSGDKISKDINGNYNKEIFLKVKDMNPKTNYGKFIRILLLTRLSFFDLGKTYGNVEAISSNFKDKYNTRLKNTIILNKDYIEVIKKYDSPNTFFYLDPPYTMADKSYYKEYYINPNELHDLLKNLKGQFLLSYDNNKDIKKIFKDFDIKNITTTYSATTGMPARQVKEILIKNY